jgi:hypothetical protein
MNKQARRSRSPAAKAAKAAQAKVGIPAGAGAAPAKVGVRRPVGGSVAGSRYRGPNGQFGKPPRPNVPMPPPAKAQPSPPPVAVPMDASMYWQARDNGCPYPKGPPIELRPVDVHEVRRLHCKDCNDPGRCYHIDDFTVYVKPCDADGLEELAFCVCLGCAVFHEFKAHSFYPIAKKICDVCGYQEFSICMDHNITDGTAELAHLQCVRCSSYAADRHNFRVKYLL